MYRQILKVNFSLLLVMMIASCKKGHRLDCFKGNGDEITETRYPGNFTSFLVHNKIDVEVVQGSECKVEVSAGKNIIKNILTNVINDSLVIENTSTCNWVRGYKKKIKVKLTMPWIKQIYNWGVGPITVDNNFKQDSDLFARNENSGDTYINGNFKTIITSSHGNGDMILSGTAKELLVYTNGTNYTRTENLQVSDHIFLDLYSIGDAYLNLDGLNKFDYHIWSKGNIKYRGNPQTINDLGSEGSGQLIKLD